MSRCIAGVSWVLVIICSAAAQGAIYWDTNGNVAGAGANPSGIWSSTNANWSTVAAGNVATANYTANDVIFSGGFDGVDSGGFTVTVSGISALSVGAMTFSDGPMTISGGTLTRTTATTTVNYNTDITSVLAGTVGLTKAGFGTLELDASNTYTGTTTLSAGILRTTASNWMSSTNSVSISSGTWDMSNTTQSIGDIAITANTGFLNLGTNGSLTTGNDNTNTNFAGFLLGSGTAASFTKVGTGVLSFTQAQGNNYAGSINVNGGSVQVTSNYAMPWQASLVVGSSGVFNTDGQTYTIIGSLSGAGNVTDTGNTSTLYVGTNNSSTTFSGILSANTPGNLKLATVGTGNLTLTGANTATGTLTLDNGTVTLSGNGVWNGPTIVTQGSTLILDDTVNNISRLSTSANQTMAGGTLIYRANSAGGSQLIASMLGTNGNNPTVGGANTIDIDASANTSSNFTGLYITAFDNRNDGTTWLITANSLGSASAPGVGNVYVANALNNTQGGGGADGTTTMSIRPDMIGDTTYGGSGVGFIVRDPTTDYLRPLTASEMATSISSTTSNTNVLVAGATQNNIGSGSPLTGFSVNSLTLGPSGGITSAPGLNFTVNSGGILVLSGATATIAANQLTSNTGDFFVHAIGNLTIDAYIGEQSLTKDGSGTLTIGETMDLGTHLYVDGGIVSLQTGGVYNSSNPIPQYSPNGSNGAYSLGHNGGGVTLSGGTLDLYGHTQMFQGEQSVVAGASQSNGGTVTTSVGNATFYGAFNNNVATPITFTDTGSGTLNVLMFEANSGNYSLTTDSTMHGTFTDAQGPSFFNVMDGGQLPNISGLNIEPGAQFFLYNYEDIPSAGSFNSQNIVNRINPSAALQLNGGEFYLGGAYGASSSQAFTATSQIPYGGSLINASANAGGTSTIQFSNLQRSIGAAADFVYTTGIYTTPAGQANLSVSQIKIEQLNGVATGSTLNNGVLGGWAVANNNAWASYNASLDAVIALGVTDAPGYSNRNLVLGTSVDNVMVAGNLSGVTSRTVNTVLLSGAYDVNMATASSVLTLGAGGWMNTGAAFFNVGQLTSSAPMSGGVSELDLWTNGGDLQVNGSIVNNGATPVALVKAAGASTNNLWLNNANTYTGGTYMDNRSGNSAVTTLYLNAYAPGVQTLGTGGLTITYATVSENNFQGQLGTTNAVTMNGLSTLNLVGTNTIAGLTMNLNSSSNQPDYVNINNSGANGPGVLTITGSIGLENAAHSNVNPIIGSSASSFSYLNLGGFLTVDTSGINFLGGVINSVITGTGGIDKTGSGALGIANTLGINNYTGPTQIDGGYLMPFAANAIPARSAVTVGPAGTFDLYGNSDAIGSLSGSGIVQSSNTYPNNPYPMLTVGYNGASTTFSGIIQGALLPSGTTQNDFNFVKVGSGTLTLTNSANGFTGQTVIQQGSLTLAGQGVLPSPSSENSNQLTIMPGGSLTLDDTLANITHITGTGSYYDVQFQGGTISLIGNNNNASSQAFGHFYATAGANAINVTNGTGSSSSTVLTVVGLGSRNSGASINFTSSGYGTLGAGGNSPSIFFTNNNSGISNNSAVDFATVNGNDFAVYGTTNGIYAMVDGGTSPQSYQYVSTSEAGGQITSGDYNLVDATVSSVPNGTNITGLLINQGQTLGLASGATVTIGDSNVGGNSYTSVAGIIKSSTGGTAYITGGILHSVNNGELIVTVPSDAGGLEIDSTIAGGALTKAGGGTLVLGGANTYTGTTTINQGTVQLGTSNAINSGNALTINGYGAAFDLNGNSQTLGTTTVLVGSIINSSAATLTVGNLALGGGPAGSTSSINVNNLILNGTVTYSSANNPEPAILGGGITLNNTSTTFNVQDSTAPDSLIDLNVTGVITGAAGNGFTVVGNNNNTTPNMQLAGANTFDGPVTVGDGTNYVVLSLANSQALGTPSVARTTTVNNNATLALGGGLTLSNTNNQYLLNGAGVGTNNASTYLLMPYPGALVNTSGSNSIAGQVSLNSASTISVLNASDQLTLSNIGGTNSTLTKDGLGTLSLTGGAFDGSITAVRGTVDLASILGLGAGGTRTLTSSAGATILLDGSSGSLNLNSNVNIAIAGNGVGLGVGPNAGYGAGYGGALDSKGGNNLVNGTLTLNSSATITSQTPGDTLTIMGNIAGNFPLTIDGPGNTFLNGFLGTTNAFSLIKTGTGTLILGAYGNNNYSGGTTTIQNGTVQLVPFSPSLPAAQTIVLANAITGGTATFDMGGINATLSSVVFGGNYAGSGSYGQVIDSTGTGSLTLTGSVIYNANGSPQAALISSALTLQNSSGTLNFVVNHNPGAAPGTDLTVSGSISGFDSLEKSGPGTLVLSGTNSYSGSSTVFSGSGGIIRVLGGSAIPSYSSVILSNDECILDLGASQAIGSLQGTGVVRLENNVLTIGGDGNSYSAAVLFESTGSTAGLTKTGIGVQTLTAANPFGYSGPTMVIDGSGFGSGLKLGSQYAIPLASDVTVDSTSTIDINNNNNVYFGSLSGSGNIINNGNAAETLWVGANGNSTTYSGAMSQSQAGANLNKIGGGNWTLDNASLSNYSGSFVADAGTTTINGSTSLGFGSYYLNTGGALVLDNTVTNASDRLGYGGPTVKMQGGSLVLISNSSGGGTSESVGTLNIGYNAGGSIYLVPNASGPTTVTFSSLTGYGGGNTLYINGSGLGGAAGPNASNVFVTGGVTTYGANNMCPDIVVDDGSGPAFATYNSSTGFQSLNAFTYASGITSGASNSNDVLATSGQTLGANSQIESLTLGSGGNVTISPSSTLTLTSGGVLVQAGANATISGGTLKSTISGSLLYFPVYGNLTLNSLIATNDSITKTGSGTLSLTLPQVSTGNVFVTQGTVKLASGLDNTLPITITNLAPTYGESVYVTGGTLDLSGNNQTIGNLYSLGANGVSLLPGQGGAVINSSGTATLSANFPNGNNSTFGTVLADSGAGVLNLVEFGNSTMTLTSSNTLHGTVDIRGGALTLRDSGALPNISALSVNYTSLTLLDNTSLSNISRLSSTAPITLRGGTITLNGAAGALSTESLGTVTAAQGYNTLASQTNNSGNAQITIGNLNVATSAGAVVNFTSTAIAPNDTTNGYLPTVGGARILLTQVNGATPTLTNGILGGWAVDGSNFASYDSTLGVGALGAAGYAAYSGDTLDVAGPADNVNVNPATTFAGITTRTINSLLLSAADNVVMKSGTDTLTIGTGGLLVSNASTISGGKLTAGATVNTAATLYVTANNTLSINSQLVNNGSGAMTLVISGPSAVSLTAAGGNASYTGGTFINGTGAVTLDGAAGSTPIGTGGLTIRNSTVTMDVNPGQIPSSNTVTLGSNGILTLVGSNALAGLAFDDQGGTTNPALNIVSGAGGTLYLASGGSITATNNNLGSTPVITTGGLNGVYGTASYLDLGGGTTTITANGSAVVALGISSTIQDGGLIKAGTGTLSLIATNNTFAGGLNLQSGGLMLASSAAGVGTLTISGGSLLAGTSAATIPNAVSVNGSFGFGGDGSNNDVTLAGPVTLNVTPTITIPDTRVVDTISGNIGGTGGLFKTGSGSLVLSGSNNYGGATTANSGTLKLASATAIPAASNVTVNSTGLFDVAGNSVTIGSLAGSGVVWNSGAAATLTLGGNTAAVFSGTIGSSIQPVPLSLVKTGTASQSLSSANYYTGTTLIQSGALFVQNGTTGSALGSGTVSITGGTLSAGSGGTGSVSGFVQAGAATIAPGGIFGSSGVLNLNGGLSSAANTNLAYNLGIYSASGTNASGNGQPIYVGDLLNVGGSGLSGSGAFSFLGSAPASGDYRLIGGNFGSPTLSNFSVPAAPGGETFTLSTTADPNYIDLVVTGVVATFSGSGTWVSTSGSTWGNSANWVDGGGLHGVPGTAARLADTATFSGSSSITKIALDVNPSLASLSFSNSNYTLTSTGGSLTLKSPTGLATVTALSGTQTLDSTVSLNLATSAAFAPQSGSQINVAGVISGSGALSLTGDGTGTVLLSGSANSFTGGTNVTTGTLILDGAGALLAGSSLTIGSAPGFGGGITLPSSIPSSAPASVPVAAPSLAPVPEPGTFVLLAVAAAAGAWFARRARFAGSTMMKNTK